MTTHVESWDDDADFQGDLFGHSVSTAHTAYSTASFSSRMSVHSESNFGDEDWQVSLSPSDEKSIHNAISSAKQAGVPIPPNVPASALLGGSIKRLGKKNSRQKVDDWGNDLELPAPGSGGLKLKVRPVQEPTVPTTPGEDQDDFEWAEGSLGVRFGGTKREGRARSSSISAMSPSMGSCITLESEDDGLDGLVLPNGHLDFAARLTKRQMTDSDMPDSSPTPAPRHKSTGAPDELPTGFDESSSRRMHFAAAHCDNDDDDDLLSGLDVGTGGLLDSKKHNLNRNLQVQSAKSHAPAPRAAATTITFTDKPGVSRIPRPAGGLTKNTRHDPFTRLDPVYENGAERSSRQNRPAPTTTNAQLLRAKRSAPVLRNNYASKSSTNVAGTPTSQSHHLSSRTSQGHLRRESDPSRAQSPALRPSSRLNAYQQETPSRTSNRRQVKAVTSHSTKEVPVKARLSSKKRTFGDGSELDVFDDLPTSASKESKYTKTPTLRNVASTKGFFTATTSLQQHQPNTQRLRHKLGNIRTALPDRMVTPLPPSTPRSPSKMDTTPRFAQDTFATRMARQQRLADMPSAPGSSRARNGGPLMPVSTNWKAQVAARSPQASPTALKRKKGSGQQPTLIKNMGYGMPKNEKGMIYNAALQRWEGNESALSRFTTPTPTASTPHLLLHQNSHAHPYRNFRNHHTHTNSTPNLRRPSSTTLNGGSPPRAAPALISNMGFANGASRGVQVERGMVFDPQRMCWLKLGGAKRRKQQSRDVSAPMSLDGQSLGGDRGADEDLSDDDDDDPFKGFEDLKDETTALSRPQTAVRHAVPPPFNDQHSQPSYQLPRASSSRAGNIPPTTPTTSANASSTAPATFDEPPPVCEEFDLGPEFIRRQREEEAVWARRVGPWMADSGPVALGEEWRWAVRDIGRESDGWRSHIGW